MLSPNMKNLLASCSLCLLQAAAAPLQADEVVTLDTRPGVTQSFLLLEPPGATAGVVVMFPGHEGVARFSEEDGRRKCGSASGKHVSGVDHC